MPYDIWKLAPKSSIGSSRRTKSAEADNVASALAGRRSENERTMSAHMRKARTAEELAPVMST